MNTSGCLNQNEKNILITLFIAKAPNSQLESSWFERLVLVPTSSIIATGPVTAKRNATNPFVIFSLVISLKKSFIKFIITLLNVLNVINFFQTRFVNKV